MTNSPSMAKEGEVRHKVPHFFLKLLYKWMQGLIELALFLPLFLIYYVNNIVPFTLQLWIGMLAMFYLSGLVFAAIIGQRSKWIYLLIGIVFTALIIDNMFGRNLHSFITCVLGTTFFFRGHLLWLRRWQDVLPIFIHWICIAFYFFSSLIFTRHVLFEEYVPLLLITGAICLFVAIWMNNALHLQQVSLADTDNRSSDLSSTITRHNRLAVIGIALIILSIALFRYLQMAIWYVINIVGKGISYLLGLLDRGEPEMLPEEGISEPNFPALDDIVEKEPSWFSYVFTFIATVFAVVVLIIMLFFLCRGLYLLLRRGLAQLIAYLRSKGLLAAESTTGYVDEKQKIISFKDLGSLYKDRFQQWLANMIKQEPQWKDLRTNQERVRYIYRRWLLNHMEAGFKFKQSLTPKEADEEINRRRQNSNSNELITLYEKARYSNNDITDEEVTRLKAKYLDPPAK